ncbi:MAG: hypothetical protein M0R46_15825, partial [Candidatus Muirbacterium halophilum]|nr:hypothetical protein [Candidatus Muirbacterium halophilum]
MYHEINYLMDEDNNMIIGVSQGFPNIKSEKEKALEMINNARFWHYLNRKILRFFLKDLYI